MLSSLFGSVVEVLITIGLLVVAYQVFLSDWFSEKRQQAKESQTQHDSVDKIAQVKIVSDDPKDIEKFITSNAEYLSNEMVGRLVERIEAIKTDQVISADSLLKKRIDDLAQPEEEPEVVKRASRKR